jgi:hypothetical protein
MPLNLRVLPRLLQYRSQLHLRRPAAHHFGKGFPHLALRSGRIRGCAVFQHSRQRAYSGKLVRSVVGKYGVIRDIAKFQDGKNYRHKYRQYQQQLYDGLPRAPLNELAHKSAPPN